jgi:hypothetical protein
MQRLHPKEIAVDMHHVDEPNVLNRIEKIELRAAFENLQKISTDKIEDHRTI